MVLLLITSNDEGELFDINDDGILIFKLNNNVNYKLEDEIFSGNNKLKKVIIPKNIIEIGSCAFELCNEIVFLYIPSTVLKIGDEAFIDSGLSNVDNLAIVDCELAGERIFYDANFNSIIFGPNILISNCFIFTSSRAKNYLMPFCFRNEYVNTFYNNNHLENVYIYVQNNSISKLNNHQIYLLKNDKVLTYSTLNLTSQRVKYTEIYNIFNTIYLSKLGLDKIENRNNHKNKHHAGIKHGRGKHSRIHQFKKVKDDLDNKIIKGV